MRFRFLVFLLFCSVLLTASAQVQFYPPLQQTMFVIEGSPEGRVFMDVGILLVDRNSGLLWQKRTTRAVATGWVDVSAGTGGGGGGAPVGTLVNTTATSAGNLVKFTDSTKTNTAPATSANIQTALGQVYQGTNAALTALASNPNLYQATNSNLTLLQAYGPTAWQATNATLTALSTNSTTGTGQIVLGAITSAEIDTSAELATLVTDSTGSGPLVFGINPSIQIGGNGQVIFNDANSLAASADFTYDKTTGILTVTGLKTMGAGAVLHSLYATNGSNFVGFAVPDSVPTNSAYYWPANPSSGLLYGTMRSTTLTNEEGTIYNPVDLTVLAPMDAASMSFPRRIDGAGCTYPNTNDFTATTFMVPRFSGTAATNANWCRFAFGVPSDMDTNVNLLASISVRLTGTDTSAHIYNVGFASVANSAPSIATMTTWIKLDVAADGSGASDDVERVTNITLTGWKDTIVPGNWWVIELNRDGATDASTVASDLLELKIKWGVH